MRNLKNYTRYSRVTDEEKEKKVSNALRGSFLNSLAEESNLKKRFRKPWFRLYTIGYFSNNKP